MLFLDIDLNQYRVHSLIVVPTYSALRKFVNLTCYFVIITLPGCKIFCYVNINTIPHHVEHFRKFLLYCHRNDSDYSYIKYDDFDLP
jgi:hypothetical protein